MNGFRPDDPWEWIDPEVGRQRVWLPVKAVRPDPRTPARPAGRRGVLYDLLMDALHHAEWTPHIASEHLAQLTGARSLSKVPDNKVEAAIAHFAALLAR